MTWLGSRGSAAPRGSCWGLLRRGPRPRTHAPPVTSRSATIGWPPRPGLRLATSTRRKDSAASTATAVTPGDGHGGHGSRARASSASRRASRSRQSADAATPTRSFMKRYNPSLRVDQVAEYATSVHGRRLRELSDPKVATCASCHPAALDPTTVRPEVERLSAPRRRYLRALPRRREVHGGATRSRPTSWRSTRPAFTGRRCRARATSPRRRATAVTATTAPCRPGSAGSAMSAGNVTPCRPICSSRASMPRRSPRWAHRAARRATRTTRSSAPGDSCLGLGDKAVCATCHSSRRQGRQERGRDARPDRFAPASSSTRRDALLWPGRAGGDGGQPGRSSI